VQLCLQNWAQRSVILRQRDLSWFISIRAFQFIVPSITE
jgi:hypothetical protein